MIGQPTGIIRCLPQAWLDEAGGEAYLERVIDNGVAKGKCFFFISMPGQPKYEVLHFYLVIGGKARYRFNIIAYEPGGVRRVASGRMWEARTWAVLADPVVKPPREWPIKGFRGFRYTEGLW